ncbi:MerR family transcriptional regulator [Sphaerisporangium fuscum]|uniref:MerR family transcriptional regulator n=1 Tax=Sphaerisporangium fuscum TaxID=2835868 RepID=UPI001BDC860A|nr:MerR family transcriptional regulator [Sphaerisporangium fuscum]
MFTIGDFARHGRVSVRMLRHYDAIGLLRPAHVDPANGYRLYHAGQLARLNRIIALKDLGFTLQQVSAILGEQVSGEELRGMLRLRRAELEERIAADLARLGRVEARLRMIESEGQMPSDDIVIKRVPAVRVAELSARAAGFEPHAISPVIQPLYDDLCARIDRAGVTCTGPAIAYYEAAPEGEGAVVVHAAMPVSAELSGGYDFDVVDLPEIPEAATIVHRGSMDDVVPTSQTLARWIEAHGYRSLGYSREVYLEVPDDPAQWVTELQEPVNPT